MKDQSSYSDIWIGSDDLGRDEKFIDQATQEMPDGSVASMLAQGASFASAQTGRRDFLKYLGFSISAATIAASCEIPIKRAIPFVTKPDDLVPGIANYYATSYVVGGDYCSVLVKTREGRPIKVEGNPLSTISAGGTSARAQAAVLSLYDIHRLRAPQIKNAEGKFETATWAQVDELVSTTLKPESRIAIVANSILSPTEKNVLKEFQAKYPNSKLTFYDPVSSAAILKAHEAMYGVAMVPGYHFEKAKVIVSVQADFLGTWISPVQYAHAYSKNRKIKDATNAKMSRHIQIESYMSLTGTNADNRIRIKPSESSAVLGRLYDKIASSKGESSINGPSLNSSLSAAIDKTADELLKLPGESLLVCGTNNIGDQALVCAINHLLGNEGSTVDIQQYSYQRQGDESKVNALVTSMNGGEVDALIIYGSNPVYELPFGAAFGEAMSKVALCISTNDSPDESTALCKVLAPDHHFLESWGDAEPVRGHVSMIQPTIAPLFDTRQRGLSLLKWIGGKDLLFTAEQPYYEYLKTTWASNVSSVSSWNELLHDGVFTYSPVSSGASYKNNLSTLTSKLIQPGTGSEITFMETVTMGNGQHSNNPWLQEMPDPVTRCGWGNYLALPVAFDGTRKFIAHENLENGELADVVVNEQTLRVPVIKQFGQTPDTFALALGYGRTATGRAGLGVGVNVNPLLKTDSDGLIQYYASGVTVSDKKGKEDYYSCVQYHHTMGVTGEDSETKQTINADEAATVYMSYGLVRQGFQGSIVNRTIIRKSHLENIDDFIHDLQEERHEHQELNKKQVYPGHDATYARGHHWGMHVDLNSCIGCGACTVACMAENNVPVVGKREMSRHHEMAWLRIDRYYYGDVDNPSAVYQPLMCQHCNNAPCENVCPVNATNHSSEGLNQMAYNRCVGTRYCANNCPYKVRRFNWLDYTTADLWPINEPDLGMKSEKDGIPYGADNLTRMVLNPDVTVRSRGVIEKCSFCVQRIQEGKLRAKTEDRLLRDADVKTACQSACPTGAITFGDFNNETGDLNEKLKSPLNYIVLEEVNTRSAVNYQARIINKAEGVDA
ncbi:MAG: 4Fe-4S dicluster domain-containing protein [Saprospiraceae bacterium]